MLPLNSWLTHFSHLSSLYSPGTDHVENTIFNHVFDCCASIRCYGNVITQLLPQNRPCNHVTILSSDLSLGLASLLFLSDFPTKILCTVLFYLIRATCPTQLIFLQLINLIISGEECSLMKVRAPAWSWNGTIIGFSVTIGHASRPVTSLRVRSTARISGVVVVI
jgi:hypothetical protein